MGKGKPIGEEAREIIYRVYTYCAVESEKFTTEDRYFQKIQQRVADATGVSVKYIYHLLKEKGKYQKNPNKPLKRKLHNNDCTAKKKQDDKSKPDTTPKIFKIAPAPQPPKISDTAQTTLLKGFLMTPPIQLNTVTSDDKAGDTDTTPTPIQQTQDKPRETSVLPVSQSLAGPISINIRPALTNVDQLQHNTGGQTILNSTQSANPGTTFIRLLPIPTSSLQRVVLTPLPGASSNLSSNANPAPGFLNLYQVPRHDPPNNVITNNTTQQHQLQVKTVPIEYDPGSFNTEIKVEKVESDDCL